MTRAVVRVIHEGKKPDVQVDTVEEEKPTGRINLPVFIASLPSDIRENFRSYMERWIKAGYTIHWGKVGFSLGIPWKGKLIYFFCISVLH